MRIAWVNYFFPPHTDSFGYMLSGFQLRAALENSGVEVAIRGNIPAHPKIHLHYCPYHAFIPCIGRRNVLYTMWEGNELPAAAAVAAKSADDLIVPSEHNRRVFEAAGCSVKAVVPLGVGHEFLSLPFGEVGSLAPKRGLRVLWVGARNPRKGHHLIGKAWEMVTRHMIPPPYLYMKTVGDEKVHTNPPMRITVDQRALPPEQHLRLYREADLFLSTSWGEGFGLPVLEAMAAGLLVVSPAHTGLAEFVSDETAYVIKASLVTKFHYGVDHVATVPSEMDVAEALRWALNSWGSITAEARRKGGRAKAETLTWSNTARTLLGYLRGTL